MNHSRECIRQSGYNPHCICEAGRIDRERTAAEERVRAAAPVLLLALEGLFNSLKNAAPHAQWTREMFAAEDAIKAAKWSGK